MTPFRVLKQITAMVEKVSYIYIFILVLISAYLGSIYSIYNIDSFHWGYIAGTSISAIHGDHLFSEIYLQYGAGQPLLFKALNNLVAINYTSIGIITSVLYSSTFILVYATLLKIASRKISLLIATIFFLLHPYAIYPWPDYITGGCLVLFCYFLCRQDRNHSIFLNAMTTGILLFLACFFRNTYFINILAASFSYLTISSLFKEVRDKGILYSILIFLSLSILYFVYLYCDGVLADWYIQGIGSSTRTYKVGSSHFINIIQSILIPIDLAKGVYSTLLIITTFNFLKKISEFIKGNALCHAFDAVACFMFLLGAFGFLQGMINYEIFRLQNACYPLFIVGTIYLEKKEDNYLPQFTKERVAWLLRSLVILLFIKFPYTSAYYNLLDEPTAAYSASEIPIFKNHKFAQGEKSYYHKLTELLCDGKSKIINLTMDSTIPYLCAGQINGLMSPFYVDYVLESINPAQAAKISKGSFTKDELVVAHSRPNTVSEITLNEIGRLVRPDSIKYIHGAEIIVYRVNEASES